MARCEFKRRQVTCREFSLGPLQWRSTSIQSAEEADGYADSSLQNFVERLQALINDALMAGCSSRELNTLLRKHIPGDYDGDA